MSRESITNIYGPSDPDELEILKKSIKFKKSVITKIYNFSNGVETDEISTNLEELDAKLERLTSTIDTLGDLVEKCFYVDEENGELYLESYYEYEHKALQAKGLLKKQREMLLGNSCDRSGVAQRNMAKTSSHGSHSTLSDVKSNMGSQNAINESVHGSQNSINESIHGFQNSIDRSCHGSQTSINQLYNESRENNCEIGMHRGNYFDTAKVKLPPLKIPVFNGEKTEWLNFRDLFISSIHNNRGLSNSQKLQYLKGFVSGEAALALKNFSITESNYLTAWKKLNDRYNKSRTIISSLIERYLNLPNVNANLETLRKVVDESDEIIRSLRNLSEYAGSIDPWLIHLLLGKLDEESKRLWGMKSTEGNEPCVEDFHLFLESRCESIDISGRSYSSVKVTDTKKIKDKRISTNHNSKTFVPTCIKCSKEHNLYQCDEFKGMPIDLRRQLVEKNNVCFNCLRVGHSAKNCQSKHHCLTCCRKHHTLLHLDSSNTSTESNESSSVNSNLVSSNLSQKFCSVLPSATVHILDANGSLRECRVLIDSGSESSFIRESFVNTLSLKRSNANVLVQGISNSKPIPCKGKCTISISSRLCKTNTKCVDVLILSSVTNELSELKLPQSLLQLVDYSQLADLKYDCKRRVDVLLGADVAIDIWENERVECKDSNLKARNSIFGWVIYGCNSSPELAFSNSCQTLTYKCECLDLNEKLTKFWETENITQDDSASFSAGEEYCEKLFVSSHKRLPSGRYVIKLPFKSSPPDLGGSLNIALRKFCLVEKRFEQDTEFRNKYIEFMSTYISSGHMRKINDTALIHKPNICYLSHHGIMQKSVTGSKLRVVFNASAKTLNGKSLNDNLFTGPNLQKDLVSILLRFRQYKFVIVSDVEKMYRQILVSEDDIDYLRVVWREDSSDDMGFYQLLTVTYGTVDAPFEAMRVIRQLSEDEKHRFPKAATILKRDIYMDDVITGANSIEELMEIRNELIAIFNSGGFTLKKWAANDERLLTEIGNENCSIPFNILKENDDSLKTLGLYWCPMSDNLQFKFNFSSSDFSLTKRKFLSLAASIYDPLGLLAPITVILKQMFQSLSSNTTKTGWDDLLPKDLQDKWDSIKSQLTQFSDFKISRLVLNNQSYQLHGFCDSSLKSYAAAVYLRSVNNTGKILVRLLIAKTKVAPLTKTTIPRLELNGALLLAKLVKYCTTCLSLSPESITCWCDSQVVLAWLSRDPSCWKQYVSNRVKQIIELVPRLCWFYVKSENNPSDVASRGMEPTKLLSYSVWWNGPQFLYDQLIDIASLENEALETSEELKLVKAHVTQSEPNIIVNLAGKYSSFRTLRRVVAYIRRYVENLTSSSKLSGPLTVIELKNALNCLIKNHQNHYFNQELKSLTNKRPLPCESKLKSLSILIDDTGLIRINNRLTNSSLDYCEQHPLIIDNSNLAKIVVKHYHEQHYHSGIELTMNLIRQKFWILKLRNIVKDCLRNCKNCLRYRIYKPKLPIGDLPSYRLQCNYPFANTGVDYAGPISVRPLKCKGNFTTKGYIVVFVCLVTKAIHLEVAMNLDTNCFLSALKRFIARRGYCNNIVSDNGRNFLGAKNEFDSLGILLKSGKFQSAVIDQTSEYGIDWKFIPSYTPHFGGLWESSVKSVKNHLKKTFNDLILTVEEFNTALCIIESILNSRPLTPITEDISNTDVLTPGHFLIGRPLLSIPDISMNEKISDNNRYIRLKAVVTNFWKRWRVEYLNTLKSKSKQYENINLKVDDLVIIKRPNDPPSIWATGRIVSVYPGNDNVVRVVEVFSKGKNHRESVVNLIPLVSKTVMHSTLTGGRKC